MRTRRVLLFAAATLALTLGAAVPAGAEHAMPLPTSRAHLTVGPVAGAVTSAAAAQAAPSATSCTYAKVAPADKYEGLPQFPSTGVAPYTARLLTTQGLISFQASTTAAPCTTYSFEFLAQHGYFDGTHCHRLTTQGIYVLQCGDPTGTGSGGPGYQFNDENLTGATYPAGTVAMANAGPNTNGSQFFFCWKDTKLSPAYTPFGKVTQGLDVLQRIAAAGEDDQNGPGDGYPAAYTAFLHVQISRR
jgi:peptidyl-prolyl cis-trans isomerase B (cyclophilin B)